MKLTFYGGIREIGGTKILLEYKDVRLLFDFGKSFSIYNDYFAEFVSPRKSEGLKDFFEFNLMPDISGIYRNDYLVHMGRAEENRGIDGVFLTHAHADHVDFLHFLRVDIPVYCTEATKNILRVIEKTTSKSFKDLSSKCDDFTYTPAPRAKYKKITRTIKDFIVERKFHHDIFIKNDLRVEKILVDHSLPGACAFIISIPEGNLVYTGDFRFNNVDDSNTQRFVEKITNLKPKWIICEGTNIDNFSEILKEENVEKKMSEVISKVKGFVFVEHPIRDTDRIMSIYNAAKINNKIFVITLKIAYLINALEEKNLTDLKLENFKVFIPSKKSGLINRNTMRIKTKIEGSEQYKIEDVKVSEDWVARDYSNWEREIIAQFKDQTITFRELKKNPKKYVISMSEWEIKHLIDLQPENAIWIKSSVEPFDLEMEFSEERKLRWLDHFKIQQFNIHASGHASSQEIINLINNLKPEVVIPIHTQSPETFQSLVDPSINVLILEKNQEIMF